MRVNKLGKIRNRGINMIYKLGAIYTDNESFDIQEAEETDGILGITHYFLLIDLPTQFGFKSMKLKIEGASTIQEAYAKAPDVLKKLQSDMEAQAQKSKLVVAKENSGLKLVK